ncbi:MAG TPA: hypothetical protein VNH38_06875 [Candidatus Dormibacteraeota bacterium]|nr:hypothetical protein [Candidatus Dormibacteraeota bacterium]
MTSREDKRLAAEIAGWLEGNAPAPTSDPTARAIARTAVLLVDALAPTPLHPVTRARLYERALAEARPGTVTISFADAMEDPWGELWRAARQIPAPAWMGLAAFLAGAALVALVLRQKDPYTETDPTAGASPGR